jgi:hypothetical protein
VHPPVQAPVGDRPQSYLKMLNEIRDSNLQWPKKYPEGSLDRQQLRKLCTDAEVDVLIAYAAVMAWGGRRVYSRNYRISVEESSCEELITILTTLRESNADRRSDFEKMQKAAENILGLGISFYTKLLFFSEMMQRLIFSISLPSKVPRYYFQIVS